VDIKEGAKMRKEEEAWINKFNIRDNSGDCKTNQAPCWQLQYTYQEFINWLNSHKKHVLSFDGASKGNPGEGGAGGAIRNPRGQLMDTYSWNLGIVSNNVAEAYALLKGIQIAKERHINQLTVIGDSKTIIRHFVKNTAPKNSVLQRIIARIKNAIKEMNIVFLHIRRHNNGIADEQANNAIGKGKGNLVINGINTQQVPP
jgi:ribonuclease HI